VPQGRDFPPPHTMGADLTGTRTRVEQVIMIVR
jgi:hypothetical protein